MRHRILSALAAALLIPAAASATFHFVSIVEVFPGTAAAPNAQYVVLQAYSAGQNHVDGHGLYFFDATGAPITHFSFTDDVSISDNQMKMLIATPEAAALFNVPADLAMTTVIDPAGGKVCWDVTNVDCVSWGNYTGSATGVGTAFHVPVGLELGRAAQRRLDIAGGATTLDAADDTDDSANDFVPATPAPKNNAGTAGTIPASTCGNSTLESLEQCDDGNTGAGDGCSAVCAFEPEVMSVAALRVDPATMLAPGNGVLEPGESVVVDPQWLNTGTGTLDLTGRAALFTGPAGATYGIVAGARDYGTLGPAEQSPNCDIPAIAAGTNCYMLSVSAPAVRPAQHWDTQFTEVLSDYAWRAYTLHVGDSFPDVPSSNIFYSFVETLFHNGVTGGCAGGNYCPTNPVTRAQMAVFLLKSSLGSNYTPPACLGTVFADVPCSNPFAAWIEDLANKGITGGCGGGNYCPDNSVTRGQMAVFLLKTLEGSSYDPPDCAGIFQDVPCTPGTGFSDWIEELYNRQVTGGCSASPLLYCPDNPNNRGQMAVFLQKTFLLFLYGTPDI